MRVLNLDKIVFFIFLIIPCFSCSSIYESIPPYASETPIRFQVSIPTNILKSNSGSVYESDWGVLILPLNYKAYGKPVPLVIGCHGSGGTVNSSTSQSENIHLYKYLVSLGYAVMDMAGMPESYSTRLKIDKNRNEGSYIAIKSYERGYKWVIKNFNIDSTGCYVTGGSHGGLASTNIICQTSIPVKCQAGMSPEVSLKEGAWNLSLGAISGGEFSSYQNRANIIRIYGMKDVITQDDLLRATYEDDKVGMWDPFQYITTLNSKLKYRCPVKFWQPVDDPIIKIEFTRRFVKKLIDTGNSAELVEMHGGGHDPEDYGSTISFFYYQNIKLELKQPVYELAQWFGKFSGIIP